MVSVVGRVLTTTLVRVKKRRRQLGRGETGGARAVGESSVEESSEWTGIFLLRMKRLRGQMRGIRIINLRICGAVFAERCRWDVWRGCARARADRLEPVGSNWSPG